MKKNRLAGIGVLVITTFVLFFYGIKFLQDEFSVSLIILFNLG